MQVRENRQAVSLERQGSGPTFEDGIWYAIQLLVADREFDEPVLAEGIASAAGLTASQMRSLQRKSGYKNARMCRFIKEYEQKRNLK